MQSDNECPGEGWQGDLQHEQCGEELTMTQVWSPRDWEGGGAIIEIGKSGGGPGLGLEDDKCVLRRVEADLLLGGHLGQNPVQ